jgi:hypothetical protein
MRKLLWGTCLAGVAYVGGVFCASWYAWTHPDSFLGKVALSGAQMGARCNPLLGGLAASAAGFTQAAWNGTSTVTQTEAEDFERPDDPTAVEGPAAEVELGGLAEMPLPRIPAIVLDELKDLNENEPVVPATAEPPLADRAPCGRGVITDDAVMQAAGWFETPPARPMPPCCEDDECPVGWVGRMIQKVVEACHGELKAACESSWFEIWFGYFSAPPTLNTGDTELSEPKTPSDPNECKEDPYHHYHHSGCPYTGRMPEYVPPAAPKNNDGGEKGEPKKMHHKKVKLPKLGGAEDSETTPVHPEVDTMEFRKSDRTWDDYGWPYQL